VRRDVVDGLPDGCDLLSVLVRDLDPELVLELHDQLDEVEGVGVQVLLERRLFRDIGFLDPELLGQDFLDSLEDFKNIIVERLGCEPEQVTMDASFQEDLNADSLDLVELIYAFEENTGLEIPDEDAEKITTVGQAWEYIQEKAGS